MGWLYDRIRLKLNNYIIIDNFFPDDICTELREKSLYSKFYNEQYFDYKALNFDSYVEDESLEDISDKYVVPKISLARNYDRAWSFVYDNVGRGVGAHADPSFINVNIWVTPDECVQDHNKNGLRIYKKKAPKEWNHFQYNSDTSNIETYLKGSKCDRVPYRYNRAIVFRGNTFHETDSVHMKPGDENRRVNYTFLYH